MASFTVRTVKLSSNCLVLQKTRSKCVPKILARLPPLDLNGETLKPRFLKKICNRTTWKPVLSSVNSRIRKKTYRFWSTPRKSQIVVRQTTTVQKYYPLLSTNGPENWEVWSRLVQHQYQPENHTESNRFVSVLLFVCTEKNPKFSTRVVSNPCNLCLHEVYCPHHSAIAKKQKKLADTSSSSVRQKDEKNTWTRTFLTKIGSQSSSNS